MSPGPLTSRQHGGHGFGLRFHGHGFGRIAPPARNRTYYSSQQRFSVQPDEGGGSNITLDEGESVSIASDPVTGAVTITIAKPSANGNGGNGNGTPPVPEQQLSARRTLYGRTTNKMTIASNVDGEVVITPGPDGSLQVIGDPTTDVIAIVELVTQPLITPNEQ
jgi:hypothetical protein